MEERNGYKCLNAIIGLVGAALLVASLYTSLGQPARYIPRYRVEVETNNREPSKIVPFTFPDGSGGGAITIKKGSRLEKAVQEKDSRILDTVMQEEIMRIMKETGKGVNIKDE